MTLIFVVAAIVLAALPVWPVYRYFYRVLRQNAAEFSPAFKKDFNEDLTQALITDRVNASNAAADSYGYAIVAMFMLPVALHAMLSFGVYFFLQFLLR